ncbi:MAG: hypothetical protein LBL39_02030 [Planctomycetaceae bacterium]|nr:hypothetical protein [Planctomycetaceae bacterium]
MVDLLATKGNLINKGCMLKPFKIQKAEYASATTWSGCSWAKPIVLPATVYFSLELSFV